MPRVLQGEIEVCKSCASSFSGEDIRVLLLPVLAKNEKSDLSKDEKNELKKLLQVLPENYRRSAGK